MIHLCSAGTGKGIDWNLIVAALAFLVSVVSVIMALNASKSQALIFILNQVDKRISEANNVVYNYPDLTQDHILSRVVSVIVSTEQLLTMLEEKYAQHVNPNDKVFIRDQMYLTLHVVIRTQLWTINENHPNKVLREQIISSRNFLMQPHLKWDNIIL